MVRIKDIADACGVSTATVSYVIHGKKEKVSEKVRKRIEKEIEKSGYVTNQSAINLVSRSSGLIGVAVMDESGRKEIMEDPYFSVLFSNLEREFKKRDKYILIILDQSPEVIIRDARRWNLDGLVMCNFSKEKMTAVSQEFMKPIVMIDAGFVYEYDGLVQIFIDDFDGGYQVGKYLYNMGHRDVAMLDNSDEEETRHRWRGFQKAYSDNGIKLDEDSHFIVPMKESMIEEALKKLYSRFAGKSAVFCVSDFYALRLIKLFNEKGIRVPDDISVAGYDDIIYSKLITPELTTVHQDLEQKAYEAVKSMMAMLNKKTVKHCIKLPVKLVERESTQLFKINKNE